MSNPPELARKLAANSDLLAAIYERGTFTGAAEQVGIAQPAVSQRIRGLEEALSMPLFDRTTRKLKLTPVGETVCKGAVASAAHWKNIVESIEGLRNPRAIRISASSSLAMKWVIPALPRLIAGGIDAVVKADDGVVNLLQGSDQLAIRYGIGPYPGTHSEVLCPSYLVPVAGPKSSVPELAESTFPLNPKILISDSSGETDGTEFNWSSYFKARSWREALPSGGLSFARADLALQAAICGMGIALGRTLLIEDELQNGFLVQKGKSVRSKAKYWIVTTASFSVTPAYKTIRDFLKEEVKRSQSKYRL